MADSLFSILTSKNFDEPPEVASIKKYVLDNYKCDVVVLVRDKDIVVTASSAALANTLRLCSPDMKRRCQLNKRLVFRIG
jgi:hypothetical protein